MEKRSTPATDVDVQRCSLFSISFDADNTLCLRPLTPPTPFPPHSSLTYPDGNIFVFIDSQPFTALLKLYNSRTTMGN